ncbi:hypothetical protein K7T73_13005 [Bacillus badius]|uniref:hypothetical protein n=1 Tax=Bacillus badius TaxID=1455 RepID=UPI001CBDF05C|nr:hypothetical protein [Bacillus badius]UAT29518.1 hypothetical protein K7T73_13005 [Bacillus badius]
MSEAIAYLYLYLDVIIRLLLIALIVVWIVAAVYSIKTEKQKKKELDRLRDMNDALKILTNMPIKKARQLIKEENQHRNTSEALKNTEYPKPPVTKKA